MNTTAPKILSGALCALLLLSSQLARADDTEIFVTRSTDSPGAERSNILFIIDTSGSMDTQVETQAEWDPDATFDGCYRSDSVYYSTGSQPPPCDSDNYVPRSINACAASTTSLRNLGQYTGQVLGWDADRERWDPLTSGITWNHLECQADRGIDGGGSSSSRFAANGADGPWAATGSQEPAWNTTMTIFDGNWLNWQTNPPTVMRSRLEIVQYVVNQLVGTLENVNVGLMRFNPEDGGPVVQAVTDVATSRAAMQSAVQDLTATGFTPLSETLYEAALYFRAGNVDFGNVGPVRSVAESRLGGDPNGASYRSPVSAECQQNFIVLLTDGEPSFDEKGPARIQALPGFSTLVGSCDGSGEGACLDDLAEYLYEADASLSLGGLQNVRTYTIGFDIDIALLESTARRGGGSYYLADDTGTLTAALTEVVAGIQDRGGTFVAPVIPIGAFSQSSDMRDVFVSLFLPTGTAHWPGNIKKYQFSGGQLLAQGERRAVDPLTGFFEADVTSFWSTVPDGNRVTAGGAASRLPVPANRTMFTDIAGPVLSDDDNRVEVANSNITAASLGVAAGERDELVSWIQGADTVDIDGDTDTSEPRFQMGDPLHVRPVVLSYGSSPEEPGTVVFTATNDGLVHAIDADTGVERWSYLPGRQLARQNELRLDELSADKRYGLDGEIRLYLENTDGEPGIADGDRAILIFGMGRGGTAVYALDVTDPDAPELLWEIDSETDGFSSIGQIWAMPVVTRVQVQDAQRTVVILSGGYDDAQDNRGYRQDNIGNAMFMVDLETGARIWSAGPQIRGHDLELPDMTNSIPAAPRVIDLTGDGLADRMYVGDTGGRLWRFDIINGNSVADLVEGGVLASLGAADLTDPPAASVRRFYTTPDAVFVNCIAGTFLAINIGSGYRGHPLDTDVEDALFSVRDLQPFGVIDTLAYGTPLSPGDLLDITDDVTAEVPPDAAGWRLRMVQEAGEKILSSATTFERTTFFTSFSPTERVNACAGGIGTNRAYQVDACNGNPVNNLDGSTDTTQLSAEDRSTTLSQTGIAPDGIFLFPSTLSGKPTRCIGLTCFPPDGGDADQKRRTYWVPELSR